jgi:hypothetical protein
MTNGPLTLTIVGAVADSGRSCAEQKRWTPRNFKLGL